MSTQIIKINYPLIVLLFTVLSSCASLQPERVAFITPENQVVSKDWNSILDRKAKIDSFIVFNTDSVQVPLEGMLNTKKLIEGHNLEELLWVDVYAYLFHHQEKGWIMIDTGLDSSFQEKGNIEGILSSNYIKQSKQKQGQNIEHQVLQQGSKIEGIFLTHLHGDHTAGLPELDSKTPKYIGKNDQYYNIPLLYHANHLNSSDTLTEIDWEKGITIAPFNSIIDIFGDGSLLAIHTPGHSTGHLSYLMITNNGAFLLTGDASHKKYGFMSGIEPGWVDNETLAVKSLNQLITFKRLYPKINVIYDHER